jgi:cell division protein FtsB
MKKTNIRRLYYHITHTYFTLNNLVIVIAFAIAAGWAWGSVNVMQRNYALQAELDSKKQQLQVADLEAQTLQFERKYYQSDEYKELEVRKRLGLAAPGEHVVVLPPNSQAVIDSDKQVSPSAVKLIETSKFQQWMNFLFGGNTKNLQK